MPTTRRDFFSPLEQELVYWDASFAIALVSDTADYHDECYQFRERLRQEGILSLISDFVLDEVAFFTVKNVLLDEAQRTRVRWRAVKRQRPDLVVAAAAVADQHREELECRALTLCLPPGVTRRAFQLMQDHALLPTDAYHIATALENGVNSFVTLDQDFLDVDGIIVYTCLP